MLVKSIDLEFGDGTYTFALPIPHIEEIQRKCGGAGIGTIFGRVLRGCEQVGTDVVTVPTLAEFHIRDLVETIRHGLIGGGRGVVDGVEVAVSPTMANRLVALYVADAPLAGNWALAASILAATVVGYDPPKKDGPAGKPAAEAKTATAG